MPTRTRLTRPIAVIAIAAGALLATPTLGSATSISTERNVDKTGWYGGFKITVEVVTAQTDSAATTMDVMLSYENLVGEALTPPDKAYLEVNGGEVVDTSFTNPKIAGFGKGKGTATATLVGTAENAELGEVLDTVVLVYGEADGNLTKIPFAENAEVESLEPRGIPVGQTVGDLVTVELSKAYLWPSYQTGNKGRYELWVELTMACTPECGYGYNVYPANFSVTSPSGKSVSADSRSPWTSELLDKQFPIDGKWLIFVIDAPAQGDYTFSVKMDSTPAVAADRVDVATTIPL